MTKKDLSQRQLRLLSLVVEDYIKTGKPVSSFTLLENHDLNLSSATVRNEMNVLEEFGYLEKPNSSSGRIPTNKAYVWQVNDKENDKDSLENLKMQIDTLFEKRRDNVDVVLEEALRLINKATNTACVTTEKNKSTKLEDIKLYKLDGTKSLVLLVFSNGKVVNNEIKLKEINFEDLKTSIKIFNERLVGTHIYDILDRAETMKKIISSQVKSIESNFKEIVGVMFKNLNFDNYKYNGLNNVVTLDNVKSIETMKKLIEIIETNSIWKLIDKSKSISTHDTNITLDLDDKQLNNITVVTKNIDMGETSKSLAIVGPKNQDYKVIVELLSILEKKLKNY